MHDLRQVWYYDTWTRLNTLLPSENVIAFNEIIFDTFKFFEGYLIYGIKDTSKKTWAFEHTYSHSRMIFNANAILHLQNTYNWNIPIHILEGYSMPWSLTAIFWPSSKHCQQKKENSYKVMILLIINNFILIMCDKIRIYKGC